MVLIESWDDSASFGDTLNYLLDLNNSWSRMIDLGEFTAAHRMLPEIPSLCTLLLFHFDFTYQNIIPFQLLRLNPFTVPTVRTYQNCFSMERRTIPVVQVTPTRTTKWCVLVQVIERRNPKKKGNGPLNRSHVVTDTQGTKVCIMVYDKNVDFFNNTLHPYKRYYVSNTTVKETPENYRTLEYPYTWTLHRKNLVEPYLESVPPPLPCTFLFNSFSDLYRFADQERPICIKALVVHTLPIQEHEHTSSYRDCIVINEEKIPMIMRVWDDVHFDTDVNVYARYKVPTLIIAYGLKVTTHHGLSLRTKSTAYIMENPPLNEAFPLKDWYNAHATEITTLIENRAYRNPAYLFHPPRAAEIQPLTFAVSAIENVKTVWTEGTLVYLPKKERLWFEACEKCLTELDVDSDWKIMCSYCKEYTKVTVCSDIPVFLTHGVTTIESNIRSPEIDKLLPITANQLRLAAAEGKPLTKQVDAALEKKHVICFMKYYDQNYRGIGQRCYPLIKIYTETEVHEYELAQQASALAASLSEDLSPAPHIGSSSSAPQHVAGKPQQTAALAANLSAELTPAARNESSFSPPQPVPEKQLFTPTIKTVLAEVGGVAASTSTHLHEQIGAKRALAFEALQSNEDTNPPATQNAHDLPPPSTTVSTPQQQSTDPTETTPTKKAKNKDKKV